MANENIHFYQVIKNFAGKVKFGIKNIFQECILGVRRKLKPFFRRLLGSKW